MNKPALIASVALAIALSACHRPEGERHGPRASKPEPASNAVTHYTEATELFVEFPLLVKGAEAAFAAHLTRLSDFRAVSEGRLAVVLSGGGLPEEGAEAQISATPGIFRPVLTPQHPGKRRLSFRLTAPGLNAEHDIGEVEVHADRRGAEAAAKKEAPGDEGIRFTKEQQWKIDFASAPAIEREVRESIAVTATLRPRAAGEAQITAPGAGLLRQGPGGFPQVGMKATAGQVLAYLVPRLGGEMDAAALNLAVERARIQLQQASRERQRIEELVAIEAIPAKRLVEARYSQQLAEAELKTAEQRAMTYAGGSGGIPLKSPIAGTVVAVNAVPGAAVSDGQMVVHIASLEKLWLEARVPENALGLVRTPTGVFFMLDGAPHATVLEVGVNARLIAFGGLVDKDTRTVPAIFEFDNPRETLRAGMMLSARLYTGHSVKRVAVPASAIVDDGGQAVVFVQKEGESFERRIVQLGPRDGDWVAVASGLSRGERIVTRGAYQVRLAAAQPAAMGHGHAH